MSNIQTSEYLNSMGVDVLERDTKLGNINPLNLIIEDELGESFTFRSSDDLFKVRTIKKSEFKALKLIINKYYYHLKENPGSMISRIYGLHKIKFLKSSKKIKEYYIIIIDNSLKYGKKFIGNIIQNQSAGEESKIKRSRHYSNQETKIMIKKNQYNSLMINLEKDLKFLRSQGLVNYNLIIKPINALIDSSTDLKVDEIEKNINEKDQIYKSEFKIGISNFLNKHSLKDRITYYLNKCMCNTFKTQISAQIYSNQFLKKTKTKILSNEKTLQKSAIIKKNK